jgi:Sec-independent protein secretion pathway component TatC
MLAMPLWLLYEAGIVVAAWVGRGKVKETGAQ